MIFYRLFWLSFLSCYLNFGFAKVAVSIQPQPAHMNQEINVIIQQQGLQSDSELPDLSSLSQDFEIVGTQQSMSFQYINGQSMHENTWTIILLPKHPGKFGFPSLKIGDEHSPAQTIEVLAAQEPKPATVADHARVFINWTVAPLEAMVHQQMKIKIQIYHAMPLLDAKLTPPQVENALLFHVDNPSHQVEIIHGERYEVETYEYLLFPQKAGDLTIQPPALDALEYDFVPNPIHIRLPMRIITIKESQTLALKNLSFRELKPLKKNQTLQLGDTFTREFEIQAIGLPHQMLPDLEFSCGHNCKAYLQNTYSENSIKSGDVIGIKRLSVSYLPQDSGSITIPKTQIAWLNTETQKMEHLDIPGMRLDVLANAKSEEVLPEPVLKQKQAPSKLPSWLMMVLGLLLGMLLMQALRASYLLRFWMWFKQYFFAISPIKQACFANQAQELRHLLLVWAKSRFSQQAIHDLHDLLPLVEEDQIFKEALNDLIAYLYRKKVSEKSWDGESFWLAFRQFEGRKKTKFKEKIEVNRLNPN